MELSDDIFCLKWNEFTNNMASTLRSLRGDNDFTDVTLVCEDGLVVEAHKVILAASGPFFLNILKMTKHHPHPLIYLKGVKMRELEVVVDFLYQGEVNLDQEDLDSFLALAAHLRLKVLKDLQTENLESGEVGRALTVKKEVEKQTQVESKSNSGTKLVLHEENLESGEVAEPALLGEMGTQVKSKAKIAQVELKSNSGADKLTSVLHEENLESGEVAYPAPLVQTQVKSKAKSAAERTRKWRERNKELTKLSVLKYMRKTAEKRRVDIEFDKKFRDREATRKREWRRSAKRGKDTLSL